VPIVTAAVSVVIGVTPVTAAGLPTACSTTFSAAAAGSSWLESNVTMIVSVARARSPISSWTPTGGGAGTLPPSAKLVVGVDNRGATRQAATIPAARLRRGFMGGFLRVR